MTSPAERLSPAFVALEASSEALEELERNCCMPERSPRMAELAETIATARAALESLPADGAASSVTAALMDAGGQVGRLQVGCCAPNRLPLYATILEELTKVQLTLDRVSGTGH